MSHQPGKFPQKKHSGLAALPNPVEPRVILFWEPTSFQPAHDLLLLELFRDKESVLHVLDSSMDTEQRAIVLKVGPGRMNEAGIKMEIPFKAGDHVFLQPNGGLPLGHEGEDKKKRFFRVCRPNEILGTFVHEESTQAPESPALIPDHSGEGDLGTGVLETPAPESQDRTDEAVAG